LRRGHAAYESGRYAEAVAAYEQAVAVGVRNGVVYYDLGNAYFKNGALGQAIACYRRAERLLPRDPLVKGNLEFALARREDKAMQVAVPFPLSLLRAVYVRLSLNEWIVMATCLYVFLCGLLLYRFLRRDRRLVVRLALYGLLALFTLATATLGTKIHDERGIERGVIGVDKVSVMSGPGNDYTVEFWLHEGSEVQIEESRPDWLRVSLGAKLRGWIPAGSLVRI
jgi:tetratricopeptide (TPR) repeat protein